MREAESCANDDDHISDGFKVGLKAVQIMTARENVSVLQGNLLCQSHITMMLHKRCFLLRPQLYTFFHLYTSVKIETNCQKIFIFLHLSFPNDRNFMSLSQCLCHPWWKCWLMLAQILRSQDAKAAYYNHDFHQPTFDPPQF